MAIQANCTECEHSYRLQDHYAGATVRCRECSETFVVPDDVIVTALNRNSAGKVLGLSIGLGVVVMLLSCGGLYVSRLVWFAMYAPAPKPAPQLKPAPEKPKDEKDPKPTAEDKKPAPDDKTPAAPNLEELLKHLEDSDAKVKESAFKALAKLKDPATFAVIAAHLEKTADRKYASEALKTIGSPAEMEVAGYLTNGDKNVRVEACRILTKIGTKESIPSLEAAAKMKDLQKEAENAIKEIKKR